jgi:hypothetical protein
VRAWGCRVVRLLAGSREPVKLAGLFLGMLVCGGVAMARAKSITVESNEFDDKEKAMLRAPYEAADGTYSTYTLARKLTPTASPSGEEARKAFEDARDTTERLIERDLLRGD